jgi:hypothetical protein
MGPAEHADLGLLSPVRVGTDRIVAVGVHVLLYGTNPRSEPAPAGGLVVNLF